jgi:(1->4)-alpha-D-glucan 1-alpha-D-glucosylmutase
MPLRDAQRLPVATCRLQLHRQFPFGALTALVPYLDALGISDCYCSPIFLSAPGSTHGYDVNDYRRIDPELGGRSGLEALHAALAEREMGLLLDFVPNHMGINGPGPFNAWWQDVLEGGRHSPYARFFDIDWNENPITGRAQILVPILESCYGQMLAEGKLTLAYDASGLAVNYGEQRFPLRPQSYARILSELGEGEGDGAGSDLRRLSTALGTLPRPDANEDAAAAKARATRLDTLKRELADLLERQPPLRARLDAGLRRLNGDRAALHEIVADQHYRLASWKTGVHETNYRRFFAIDTLIGMRMEIPEVFQECHALLARLVREGLATGVRIDHIDGLRLPRQYLARLQTLFARSPSLYVAVEKILARDEPLPEAWQTHGTTGYDFIAQLAGLMVEARHEQAFTAAYADFTGRVSSYADLVYEKKRLVLDELFANAVNSLTDALGRILADDLCWRDLTQHELRVAVRETMAALDVYRTYREGEEPMADEDRRVVAAACATALRRNARLDPQPFELVREVLTGDYPGAAGPAEERSRLAGWALDFQQYTGAVMAKASEDTAFYTYNRFIALNEVGGDPARFGDAPEAFHSAAAERARRMPHSLLATSTHDTKLGEDARARLYALSELPHEWFDWAHEWRQLNAAHKTLVDGRPAPSADEEYRLYQVLLAVWPPDDPAPDDAFRDRIRQYLRKAVSEARENTTWIHPNNAWLEAGDRFVDALLASDPANPFLASFRPRVRRLAHLGLTNSLAQVVLKITAPGIPDFYQGAELWDFSLVDPDNRRPVDFPLRQRLVEAGGKMSWRTLLQRWSDGGIKLRVIQTLLQFRREHAGFFSAAGYQPLSLKGLHAERALAFLRHHPASGEALLIAVPRLATALGSPPVGLVWEDTAIVLPSSGFTHLSPVPGLPSPDLPAGLMELPLADAFSELPFAVLRGRLAPSQS